MKQHFIDKGVQYVVINVDEIEDTTLSISKTQSFDHNVFILDVSSTNREHFCFIALFDHLTVHFFSQIQLCSSCISVSNVIFLSKTRVNKNIELQKRYVI